MLVFLIFQIQLFTEVHARTVNNITNNFCNIDFNRYDNHLYKMQLISCFTTLWFQESDFFSVGKCA